MRIAVLLVATQLTGCTIAFGALGGITAVGSNNSARAKKQPETASVGGRILLGALIGLVVDAIILNESLEGCCPDFSGTPNTAH